MKKKIPFPLLINPDIDIIKIRIKTNKDRLLLVVLVSGLLIFSLAIGFIVYNAYVQWRIDGLNRAAEQSIKEKKWDNARQSLGLILSYNKDDSRTRFLATKISNGYIDSACSLVSDYNYAQAVVCYRKAYDLSHDNTVKGIVEDMEYSLALPELFLDGVPYNAELIADGSPWDKSFGRIAVAFDGVLETGFEPGNVLRFKIVTPSDIHDFVLSLENEKGKIIVKNRAFKTNVSGGRFIWLSLLCLPSTLEKKSYTLSGSWTQENGRKIGFKDRINLKKRAFPEESITLDTGLSDLISVPDKQKTQESLKIAGIINSFNAGDIFHMDYFTAPTEATKDLISSAYGERRVFVYSSGGGYTSVHDGIDYGVAAGTQVHATARGKVSLARKHIVTGNTILLEHLPSVFSVYYHLSKINIKEGDIVEQGDVIGEVGTTGFSTGAHLHFSVFVGGIPADPEFFIENKPID